MDRDKGCSIDTRWENACIVEIPIGGKPNSKLITTTCICWNDIKNQMLQKHKVCAIKFTKPKNMNKSTNIGGKELAGDFSPYV